MSRAPSGRKAGEKQKEMMRNIASKANSGRQPNSSSHSSPPMIQSSSSGASLLLRRSPRRLEASAAVAGVTGEVKSENSN